MPTRHCKALLYASLNVFSNYDKRKKEVSSIHCHISENQWIGILKSTL